MIIKIKKLRRHKWFPFMVKSVDLEIDGRLQPFCKDWQIEVDADKYGVEVNQFNKKNTMKNSSFFWLGISLVFLALQFVSSLWFDSWHTFFLLGWLVSMIFWGISILREMRAMNKDIKKAERELRRSEMRLFIAETVRELFEDFAKKEEEQRGTKVIEAKVGGDSPVEFYIDGKLQKKSKKMKTIKLVEHNAKK